MKTIIINVSRTSVMEQQKTVKQVMSGDWKLSNYEGYEYVVGVAQGNYIGSFRIINSIPKSDGRVEFQLEDISIGETKNLIDLLGTTNTRYFTTKYIK
jgi:hypothetical protein